MVGKNLVQSNDDFNPEQVVRTTTEHAKEIELLIKRVDKIEARVGNNDAFADTLCECAEKVMKANTWLADTFTKLLTTNVLLRDAMKKFVGDIDRNRLWKYLNDFRALVWAGLGGIGALAIKALVDHYLSSK